MALQDIRIGFACKERWEDMVGDDRVRACGGCDRLVFNLSAMTRADAESVLATRGIPPCVRFYRRPDGTVMTTDCPSGVPKPARRLTVLASSVAAGAALAVSPAAFAEPHPPACPPGEEAAEPDPVDPPPEAETTKTGITITRDYIMGIPAGRTFGSYSVELGVMIVGDERRPTVEWSAWGRLGAGSTSRPADAVARRMTSPEPPGASAWEAAAGADATIAMTRRGDLRFGLWGEVRTSSDPVAGVELVLAGLPPDPYDSRIGGSGSIVLRAGANARVVTGALGLGYVGSFPRHDPLVSWARRMVGARLVVSVNRAIDEPRDWSATVGLELDPVAALQALTELATSR